MVDVTTCGRDGTFQRGEVARGKLCARGPISVMLVPDDPLHGGDARALGLGQFLLCKLPLAIALVHGPGLERWRTSSSASVSTLQPAHLRARAAIDIMAFGL